MVPTFEGRLDNFRRSDRNTKYYYAVTKIRRAKVSIYALTNDEGLDDGKVQDIVFNYFGKLFNSENTTP